MDKPSVRPGPCSKEFPTMKRGKFSSGDWMRMICDYDPRKKILQAMVIEAGGHHSSGVCDAHEKIAIQFMRDEINLLFS